MNSTVCYIKQSLLEISITHGKLTSTSKYNPYWCRRVNCTKIKGGHTKTVTLVCEVIDC